MICLETKTANSGLGSVQVFSPVDPQPTDYTTCTYVLQSGNEINAWPPLTISEGATIALAVGACWATAFAFRVLGQFLNSNNNERE